MARFLFQEDLNKKSLALGVMGAALLAEGKPAFLCQHDSHLRAVRKRFSERHQLYKIKSDD